MKLYSILFLLLMVGEQPITGKQIETNILKVKTGLDILVSEKFDLINGNNIGLVTNQSGINYNSIPNVRLFMELDHVHFKEIFAPEHGFFGNISAGQSIDEQKPDEFSTIYSLYGNTRKPTPNMLEGLDLIIYDIQDIGTRFYTYISILGLLMEAAAEAEIPIIILDRPNPPGW